MSLYCCQAVSESHLFPRRLVYLSLAGTLLLSVALALVVLISKARHTIEEAAGRVASSSVMPFTLSPLIPISIPTGLVSFTPRAGFESFAMFEGDLYICNRATLFRYDNTGQLQQTWRVGIDLPATSLLTLAVRQGIPQPELWIATDGAGALIWDGRAFRQLAPQSTQLRKLTALLALPDGRMLLGTLNAGLYVTDTRQLTAFHSELLNVPVTALAYGVTSEEIWIGTRTQGVWLWRAGALTRFVTELPDPQVLSIYAGNATAWVGTPAGVAEFTDGRFRRRLADGLFARALAEAAGKLWISTVDEGTLSIDATAHTPRPAAGTRATADIFQSVSLLPTASGVLALGDASVVRLPEYSSVLTPNSVGLTNSHITALHIDGRQRLWVGYFDRGLDVISPDARNSLEHFETDVLFCVNRIKEEPNSHRVFVATANGLVLFDGNSQVRQVLKTAEGLISNHVTDLLLRQTDSQSEPTVVATNAGMTFLNASGVSSVYAFQGLVNNHVYTLAQAGPLLVAGTLGGVSILKNGLVQASFTTANSGLRQNWITASAIAGDDIYLGTYGSGVIHMDSNFEVQPFREFVGTRVEINQNAMLVTKHGLYAGTAGQGLAFLPAGQQRWHFWLAGLPSANVTALAAGDGNLYIATDNGLVRIPEQAFQL